MPCGVAQKPQGSPARLSARRVPLDANPATAHMFIMKPFAGRGLMSLFSTHPPTEARIAALLGSR